MRTTIKSTDYHEILKIDVIQFREVRQVTHSARVHNVLAGNKIKFGHQPENDYRVLNIDITVFQLNINWLHVINDLRAHGVPYAQQAKALGLQWSSFQSLQHGSEPLFKKGHALLILHSKFCGTGLTMKRLNEAQQTE